MYGFGVWVSGFGFGVSGFGIVGQDFGVGASGFELVGQGSGVGILGLGFRGRLACSSHWLSLHFRNHGFEIRA